MRLLLQAVRLALRSISLDSSAKCLKRFHLQKRVSYANFQLLNPTPNST